MGTHARTLVIVGAGFSGTLLAVNLLRLAGGQSLRVVLLEAEQLARGIAYRHHPYPYLLNVPAGRMSASPDDPLEFLSFAQRHEAGLSADAFLPRELYGEYLEWLLRRAEQEAAPLVSLHRTRGLAIAIERAHRASELSVHLADGRTLRADEVILATGNPPPRALPGAEALRGSARYVADPWAASAPRARAGESILAVGTGLTMADVVVAAAARSPHGLTIHALSRHGLLPTVQSAASPADGVPVDLAPLLAEPHLSLHRLSRRIRTLVRERATQGADWRPVIAALREVAPTIWERLSPRARGQFLRHLRPYWDVHRHRLPQAVWSELNKLKSSGALQVHAGQLLSLEPLQRRVRVTYRPRGATSNSALEVDRVINCTGPDFAAAASGDRLLRSLLAQGMAAQDPLRLGLLTAPNGALIGADGATVKHVYYLGPRLRASYWEATAVAELRLHAQRLARHLLLKERDQGRPHRPSAGAAPRAQPPFARVQGIFP
jgi:uncharacterized NAD(P)/FAD-binding protein YdhS